MSIVNNTNTVYSLAVDSLQTASGIQNFILQPGIKSIQWLELLAPSVITHSTLQTKKNLGRLSRVCSIISIPNSFNSLKNSINKLKRSIGITQILKYSVYVFKKLIGLINTIGSNLRFAAQERIIFLDLRHIVIFNLFSTIENITSLFTTTLDINIIFNDVSFSTDLKYSIFIIVKKITKLVSTIIGLGVFFLGGTFATQFVLLTLSTINQGLSNFDYYYKNLYINQLN